MFERGLTAPLNGCYFRTITVSNFQHLEQCEKNSHGKRIALNKKPKKSVRSLTSGSRVAATSKMECFVIIVNGITKHSILDVAAALDPPLSLP